jgi:hypothetical protein
MGMKPNTLSFRKGRLANAIATAITNQVARDRSTGA